MGTFRHNLMANLMANFRPFSVLKKFLKNFSAPFVHSKLCLYFHLPLHELLVLIFPYGPHRKMRAFLLL